MMRYRGQWDTGERRHLRRILVVGGGRAGVSAAEELRRQGYGGEIAIMCDEPDAPYDRPSCAKGILTGKQRPRDARMPVQHDLAIGWQPGRAAELDAGNRVVHTDAGQAARYDGLVIATGARPLAPPGWPVGEPGLHVLHGLADAWALRADLRRARRVAVIGGGLTGCEVASAVRSLARECILIDSKPQVMSRALGEVVGNYLTDEVARDGVELRLQRRFRSIDRDRRGRWVLTLDDGSEVVADVVVASIGERPDTRWLASSGFDVSDGVLCDQNLRVVGGRDVVAAGTVARWPNLRYGTRPGRCGQWIMALEQGRAAAASLLASDHPTRPAALVPRFWSEQFGLRIQVCGEVPTDGSAELTVTRQRAGRRNPARAGVLVGYHRGGRQIGLVGVNAARGFTAAARTMLTSPPEAESGPVTAGRRPAGLSTGDGRPPAASRAR